MPDGVRLTEKGGRRNVRYNSRHEVSLIRVTIISPIMAVRVGLRALLGDDPDLQVIAEGASLAELELTQVEPDVVVWSPASYADIEASLLELSQLKTGETAMILIHDNPQLMERLTQYPLRAWGGLDPESGPAELVAAIHAVNEGLVVAEPAWLKKILVEQPSKISMSSGIIEPLTEREIEVLQLLAYGLTNKQIAVRLMISAHTVKFHVSSIFTKLGTTNRVEAVNLGLKSGLIAL
jgi:NarL family two-component system response regulator YdfI